MTRSDVDSIGWCHECWAPIPAEDVSVHRAAHSAASTD